MKLCGEPAGQEQRGRTIPGREIDLHAFDFLEAIMRPGMIEELGYPEPELDQAGPVEVAKDNALFCFRLRGFHSGSRPGYTQAMTEAVSQIPPEDLDTLAYYVAQFRGPAAALTGK